MARTTKPAAPVVKLAPREMIASALQGTEPPAPAPAHPSDLRRIAVELEINARVLRGVQLGPEGRAEMADRLELLRAAVLAAADREQQLKDGLSAARADTDAAAARIARALGNLEHARPGAIGEAINAALRGGLQVVR